MEGRGGRREAEKVEDEEKRQSILDHINKFPRMESHYCRTNTKNEFLASELNLTTMYNMYVSEMAADKKKPASRSLYNNIFTSLGLKFFALKKDACGICLRKMKENPTDESFLTVYQKHVDEKVKEKDSDGTEEVILFCDGCVGQNKNSVLPSMILYTLEHAKNLKKVTVNYFETNHGQNEGDCMHSVIERKVSKQPEIMVPSQLATLIQTARATGKKQYTVYEINTVDVIDWKRYGQDIGLHAWRDALDGNSLVWTKVMSVALEKRKGECDMLFRHSHMEEFSVPTNDRAKLQQSQASPGYGHSQLTLVITGICTGVAGLGC
ncbi:hypothetical protein PoB_001818000 [Plakobranchus ocellatus]|uniref:DUF7869 domain-containing protein n=1 Tax=Plakobranchus ocellatus TaxID=259542 RepID=A0AAV3ZAT6_9GAST|nr:hypothetical protein PoB_001818000 [Plakobranchus ocellatus]